MEELVSINDIYPTVLEAAGVETTKTAHGASLLPLIEKRADSWRESIVTEFGGVNSLAVTMRTIRWRNLKYGFNCCNNDELYDLDADPWETRNLVDDPGYLERADGMRRKLLEWMEATDDPAHWRTKELFSYYLKDLRVYDRS